MTDYDDILFANFAAHHFVTFTLKKNSARRRILIMATNIMKTYQTLSQCTQHAAIKIHMSDLLPVLCPSRAITDTRMSGQNITNQSKMSTSGPSCILGTSTICVTTTPPGWNTANNFTNQKWRLHGTVRQILEKWVTARAVPPVKYLKRFSAWIFNAFLLATCGNFSCNVRPIKQDVATEIARLKAQMSAMDNEEKLAAQQRQQQMQTALDNFAIA